MMRVNTPLPMPVLTEAELSAFLLPPAEIEGTLDWTRLFGRTGPVEVEIGCGKGRFLADRAQSHPERCFLGVDWGLPWLRRAARRLTRAEVENVLLHRTNAKHLIQSLIPAGSVNILHAYFPDPWPKKRHHKRRLFDPATTSAMERILAPGGQLHMATDHVDYYEVILEMVAEHTDLARRNDIAAAGGTTSNFAVKYISQGRPLHEAVWERRSET